MRRAPACERPSERDSAREVICRTQLHHRCGTDIKRQLKLPRAIITPTGGSPTYDIVTSDQDTCMAVSDSYGRVINVVVEPRP
jgi:hypothetical protein